jgi:hypothetical protein
MKLTITVVIDTEAKEQPLVVDSTCEGSDNDIAWAKKLSLALGDSLRPVVAALAGGLADAEVQERTIQ